MAYIKVEKGKCKGCMLCTLVCPKSLFKSSINADGRGYHVVEMEESNRCIGCYKCIWICPDMAIIKIDTGDDDK